MILRSRTVFNLWARGYSRDSREQCQDTHEQPKYRMEIDQSNSNTCSTSHVLQLSQPWSVRPHPGVNPTMLDEHVTGAHERWHVNMIASGISLQTSVMALWNCWSHPHMSLIKDHSSSKSLKFRRSLFICKVTKILISASYCRAQPKRCVIVSEVWHAERGTLTHHLKCWRPMSWYVENGHQCRWINHCIRVLFPDLIWDKLEPMCLSLRARTNDMNDFLELIAMMLMRSIPEWQGHWRSSAETGKYSLDGSWSLQPCRAWQWTIQCISGQWLEPWLMLRHTKLKRVFAGLQESHKERWRGSLYWLESSH